MKKSLITALPIAVIAALVAWFFWQRWQRIESNKIDYDYPNTTPNKPHLVDANKVESLPAYQRCQVENIYDGDTLSVNCNGAKDRLRLCGIDADEVSTAQYARQSKYADLAKEYVQQLIAQSGGIVAVSKIEEDKNGLWISDVWINPNSDRGESLNGLLVYKGLARVHPFVDRCPNRERFIDIEEIAKEKKLGVWGSKDSITPWSWRERLRQKTTTQSDAKQQ